MMRAAPAPSASPSDCFDFTVPRSVLAADLGGTKLSVALIDRQGKILVRLTEPVDASSRLAPVRQLCCLAAALAPTGRGRASIAAVGVAVPGLVRRTGTVWAPNLPGWDHVPLARLLRQKLGAPVVVESDRNAAVLGESWRGAARGRSDVIALIVGTGIGAGILSGGAIIRGAHELSGCAGWIVLGQKHSVGARRVGWLEALAAGPGIAGSARRLGALHGKVTAQDVASAARQSNRQARKIFRRVGQLLGLAVANLISLFNPEMIVLGGGLAGAADLYFSILERTALSRSQPLAARRVRISVSRLGGDANLLGVARLAWDAAQLQRRAKTKRQTTSANLSRSKKFSRREAS